MKKKKRLTKQNVIIPSTKILTVGVHKIQDKLLCPRYYFWRWVLNLIPRGIYLPFWFGSVVHKGVETMRKTFDITEIHLAMKKESKKIVRKHLPDAKTMEEIEVQYRIAEAILEAYVELYKREIKKVKILGTEIKFGKILTESPLMFTGTIDAYGKEKKTIVLVEYKTASRINNEYFARLKFDKQVNGYHIGLEEETGLVAGECKYVVFRKPSIRVRQNESVDNFIERFEDDLRARPEFYFVFPKNPVRFGKKSVAAVLDDIEWTAYDLHCTYDYMTKDQLLNPRMWPRDDRACFNYGVCPYFTLCKNTSNYQLYLPLFTMRDIRYEEEKEELDKEIKLIPKSTGKLKMKLIVGDDGNEH